MNRLLGWLWESVRDARCRRVLAIEIDAGGVEVRDWRDRPRWRMEWDDVAEIVAYKRDMISVDDICLGFRAQAGELFERADEEMDGWKPLQSVLAERFGISHAAWYAHVVQPPFATNWTLLWTRDSGLVPIRG